MSQVARKYLRPTVLRLQTPARGISSARPAAHHCKSDVQRGDNMMRSCACRAMSARPSSLLCGEVQEASEPSPNSKVSPKEFRIGQSVGPVTCRPRTRMCRTHKRLAQNGEEAHRARVAATASYYPPKKTRPPRVQHRRNLRGMAFRRKLRASTIRRSSRSRRTALMSRGNFPTGFVMRW